MVRVARRVQAARAAGVRAVPKAVPHMISHEGYVLSKGRWHEATTLPLNCNRAHLPWPIEIAVPSDIFNSAGGLCR